MKAGFLDFLTSLVWKANLKLVVSFLCLFEMWVMSLFWVFNLAKALLRRKLIFGF